MTPPCPPTGAMMRRKKSVLLGMISCTLLTFSGSSCAPFSKASFILSKAHSEAFIIFLKLSLYSSQFPFFRGEAFLHFWFVAIRVMAAFHLLQLFSGWRFLLPLTSCSCYPFSLSLSLSLSLLSLSLSLTLSYYLFFCGRGMKGPSRGHVTDTTALPWERTVTILATMTT